jgi:hypothetical protein
LTFVIVSIGPLLIGVGSPDSIMVLAWSSKIERIEELFVSDERLVKLRKGYSVPILPSLWNSV